jgi:hypothetical protein
MHHKLLQMIQALPPEVLADSLTRAGQNCEGWQCMGESEHIDRRTSNRHSAKHRVLHFSQQRSALEGLGIGQRRLSDAGHRGVRTMAALR